MGISITQAVKRVKKQAHESFISRFKSRVPVSEHAFLPEKVHAVLGEIDHFP